MGKFQQIICCRITRHRVARSRSVCRRAQRDLLDARFGLPQQILASPLERLTPLKMATDSSSGTLPSSSRLTIDLSSSIARSNGSLPISPSSFCAIPVDRCDKRFRSPLRPPLCSPASARRRGRQPNHRAPADRNRPQATRRCGRRRGDRRCP